MNTLQLCDSFEPYYAGKKSRFVSAKVLRTKAEAKPGQVSASDSGEEACKPEATSDEKR